MPLSQYNYYSFGDAGAPSLTATTASLINLLNAILVTGYGSKAGAGWTVDYTSSAFTGSTFRMASGSRFYLNVRDDAIITAKEARVSCNETASAFGTGSGYFPSTSSQGVNSQGYLVVRKSNGLDTTPSKPWYAFADGSTLMLFIHSGDTVNNLQSLYFGDIYSYKSSSDAYKCAIIARASENGVGYDSFDTILSSYSSNVGGHFMARGHLGTGISLAVGKISNSSLNGGSGYLSGTAIMGYANSGFLSPIYIYDGVVTGPRGKLRGVYHPFVNVAYLPIGTLVNGSGIYAGKQFRYMKKGGSGGGWFIEVSNTLDTN